MKQRKRYQSERESDFRYDKNQTAAGWQRRTIRFPPDVVEIIEAADGATFSDKIINILRNQPG